MHKIIGEGTYGCIASPALPCALTKDEDFVGLVSKLLSPEEAEKEFNEGARLASIDQLVSPESTRRTIKARYRFGVYAINACSASKDATEVRAWQEAVQHFKKTQKQTQCDVEDRTELVHMEAAQGDVSLLKHAAPTALKTFVAPWLRALQNALLGLVNMHVHHMFHFDVKPANMLWFGRIDAPLTVKLTDFGTTASSSDKGFRNALAFYVPWFNFAPCLCVAYAMHSETQTPSHFESKQEWISDATLETVATWKQSSLLSEAQKAREAPTWANLRAFTEFGLIANAATAAQRMSIEEMAAANDVFGFALALALFYDALVAAGKLDAARGVKEFFDAAAAMQLSDTDAVKKFRSILVLSQ